MVKQIIKLSLLLIIGSLIFTTCEDKGELKEKIIKFSKTFGGDENDAGSSVQQTSDGGYIITGWTDSFGNGRSDIWLIKIDTQGNEEWNQTFGGSKYDRGSSVQQTTDGGYIITGRTSSFGNGESDVWIIKTNSEGIEEWNRTFGGESEDLGLSVQQTTDGGYIIAGRTSSFGNGVGDAWLIKTDSNGNDEWKQTFGGSNYDLSYSVQQTTDGGYIMTGGTFSFSNGQSDVWLIKTDSEGIEKWNQTFGGRNSEFGLSVQQTTDGGYIISGGTDTFWSNGQSDFWLIKTDSEGIEEWNQIFAGSGGELGLSVQQTSDGGYIITGGKVSYVGASSGLWLIKTDSQGAEEWEQNFGGIEYNVGSSVQQTTDGGYIITGVTGSFGNGGWDIWLIKTDLDGNTVPIGN